jgi:REP element-mobilizing transposase RayT
MHRLADFAPGLANDVRREYHDVNDINMTNRESRKRPEAIMSEDPECPQRKKHRLPLDVYSAGGVPFFFTLSARQHGTPFTDAALARSVVEALLWRREHHSWTRYCYCLMPEHLHLLVQLPPREPAHIDAGARDLTTQSILEQIAAFQHYTSYRLWRSLGGVGPLWQKSSYDRVLRQDESVEQVAHYILNNPVRRGLVACWEDYPYARIVDPW